VSGIVNHTAGESTFFSFALTGRSIAGVGSQARKISYSRCEITNSGACEIGKHKAVTSTYSVSS